MSSRADYKITNPTSQEITLRFFDNKDDVSQLISLTQEVLDEMIVSYGDTDRPVGEPVEPSYFDQSFIIVAQRKIDNKIVGVVGMRLSLLEGQSVVGNSYIYVIGVDHTMRRKGIARDLLTNALGLCRHFSAKRIVLEVSENNLPARALYESVGGTTIVRTISFPTKDVNNV